MGSPKHMMNNTTQNFYPNERKDSIPIPQMKANSQGIKADIQPIYLQENNIKNN